MFMKKVYLNENTGFYPIIGASYFSFLGFSWIFQIVSNELMLLLKWGESYVKQSYISNDW